MALRAVVRDGHLVVNEATTLPEGTVVCQNTGGGGDTDNDRICDADDNCPTVANPDQKDLDGDKIGDVCDPVDAAMNLTRVDLKRDSGKTVANGLVRIDGDFITRPPADTLDPNAQGIRVELQDSFRTSLSQVWAAGSGECKPPTRLGIFTCLSADRQARLQLKPLLKPPLSTTPNQTYGVRVILKKRAIQAPFAGPVTVTLTQIGPGIDRQGSIQDCSSNSFGMTCREF